MRFENKTAVVTGGTSGIGRDAAIRLSQEGASTAVIGRNADSGAALSRQYGIRFYACDVRVPEQISRVFAEIKRDLGGVDILVNCAGIGDHTPIPDITEQRWNEVFDVNLKSMFFCSQQAAKSMTESERGGRIVNLSSLFAESADGMHTLYSGTKAAIRAITRNFAAAYAKNGICCNTVSPSFVRTAMTEHSFENAEWRASFCKKTPAGRLLEIDEVTSAILFLCSEESSGITGENITVDLGLNIRR